MEEWKKKYKWIVFEDGKIKCKVCVDASKKQLPIGSSRNIQVSLEAFVTNGFNTWKNATTRLSVHQTSELHRLSVELLAEKKSTVSEQLSDVKKREMQESRIVLRAIFTTVNVLARQGLPLRSHNETRSNFMQILKTRSEEIPGTNNYYKLK